MLIVGDPSPALVLAAIPNAGVGLARTEFIIANHIGMHPMALARYPHLKEPKVVRQIRARIGPEDARDFFVRRFSEGVARIAAAFHPKPVIVRMSDFKTNEYAQLLGGREFEPDEENPMLGFRGASRYYDERYAEGFALECAALRRARHDLGLTNIKTMIPFCRTVDEGRRVVDQMAAHGLRQREDGLDIYVMCEVPSNAVLAEEFLQVFDGLSIGSNDLAQLTLGLDRDSGTVAHLFDERNDAVRSLIARAICCRPTAREACRHLWTGTIRLSRVCRVARESGDRLNLIESRYSHHNDDAHCRSGGQGAFRVRSRRVPAMTSGSACAATASDLRTAASAGVPSAPF
jgi:pyruvate,water dikinase